MIFVVDAENREAFRAQLEEMYLLRHEIYVERRGWEALRKSDKRDIDQFDTDATVYLLGLDENGRVTAGLRLNPTAGPHLIRDVFPHTVTDQPIPIGPNIYEFTRWFVVKERVAPEENQRVAGELLAAMLEYGLSINLTHISLCCDALFWRTMQKMSWDVIRLGPVTPYPEGKCIAVLFDVSERMIANTRKSRGVVGSVLCHSPVPITPPANDNYDFQRAA